MQLLLSLIASFKKMFPAERLGRANNRLFIRAGLLAVLTIIGFAVLEYLIQMTKTRGWDFVMRFPEFPTMMRAACFMTFVELTVLLIRLTTQPRIDVQKSAEDAGKEPMAAAVVYLTHSAVWMFRVFVFMKLCDLL